MPLDPAKAIRWSPWVVPNGGIDESLSDHELPANKWASALDVEPLPTGCRRRNGKTAVNSAALGAISVSNEVGADRFSFSEGTVNYVAQKFVVGGLPLRVTSLSVRIGIESGTPAGNVQCALYDDAAGSPGLAVTSADFADFNTVTAASIIAEARDLWLRFAPSATLTLGASVTYWIVLKSTGGSPGNNYVLVQSTAGDPYAAGSVAYGSDGLAWTAAASSDLLFRVYGVTSVTNSGASVQGLLEYNLSDAVTRKTLVQADGETYRIDSGVLTPLSTSDLATMDRGADVRPAMSVGSDIAFISDGINQPKKYFIRGGVEYWANDGIAAPTTTPTATATSGGSLAIGVWNVDYYYWDDLLGIQSNTRYQGATTQSVTTTSTSKTIHITGLPSDVERSGDRATHIRISLKSPTGGIFRFAGTAQGQITLGTTAATITSDATTNEPAYDCDPVPVHALSVVGANRRFIVPVATPFRVMASKLDGTGAFYEAFGALTYRDFGKGDGDYATSLAFIAPATLVVGFKNSVWALDARRFEISDPVLISKEIGVAGGRSSMVVGRNFFFVSDSDRTKGMMAWDGQKVTPLVAIDKTFKGMNTARLKYATCAHMAPGDNRFQWWTLLSSESASATQDRVLVYDYSLDSWTVYRHGANIVGSIAPGATISQIWLGGTNGVIYEADSGSTDAGTTVVGQFTGKRDDYGLPDSPKRMRFLRAEGDSGSLTTVVVNFSPDVQGYPSFSGTLNFGGLAGSILGTGVLGTFVLGDSATIISTRTGLLGICRNAQPTFSSSDPWSIRGFTLGVQPVRRMT